MQSGNAIITRVQIGTAQDMSHISLEYLWPVLLKTTLGFEAGHAQQQSCPARTKTAALGDGMEEVEKWR